MRRLGSDVGRSLVSFERVIDDPSMKAVFLDGGVVYPPCTEFTHCLLSPRDDFHVPSGAVACMFRQAP